MHQRPPKPNDDPRDPILEDAFDTLEHVIYAPPRFYQQVLARAAQTQPRRGGALRYTPQLSGAWGLALATCLLLSLTLNGLWGVGVIGLRVPEQALLMQPGPAYRLQGKLQRDKNLGTFVLANSILASPSIEYSMAPLPAPAWFFRIGTGYAESLALLRSEHPAHGAQRLQGLIEALGAVQAPPVLISFLREMQTLIRSQRYTSTMLTQFLALFETLYEEAYRDHPKDEALVLFRAGAWLENMYLAAQAGDQAVLRQGPASQYFRRVLAPLGVQPVILHTLDQIRHLITQPAMRAQDVDTVRTRVQALQHQLSN